MENACSVPGSLPRPLHTFTYLILVNGFSSLIRLGELLSLFEPRCPCLQSGEQRHGRWRWRGRSDAARLGPAAAGSQERAAVMTASLRSVPDYSGSSSPVLTGSLLQSRPLGCNGFLPSLAKALPVKFLLLIPRPLFPGAQTSSSTFPGSSPPHSVHTAGSSFLLHFISTASFPPRAPTTPYSLCHPV